MYCVYLQYHAIRLTKIILLYLLRTPYVFMIPRPRFIRTPNGARTLEKECVRHFEICCAILGHVDVFHGRRRPMDALSLR
jgi:hypothetical protein